MIRWLDRRLSAEKSGPIRCVALSVVFAAIVCGAAYAVLHTGNVQSILKTFSWS